MSPSGPPYYLPEVSGKANFDVACLNQGPFEREPLDGILGIPLLVSLSNSSTKGSMALESCFVKILVSDCCS